MNRRHRRYRPRRWSSAVAIAVGLVLGVAITQYGATVMRVRGESMLPNLRQGSLVLVVRPPLLRLIGRAAGEAERDLVRTGDVVVILDPIAANRTAYVKRVVALAGQSVSLVDGAAFVDDAPLDEPWLAEANHGAADHARTVVPPASLFVLGDNRLPLASRDSRTFGPVPTSSWRGRVVSRLVAPFRDDGGLRSPFLPVGPSSNPS
ncbi:MAG: signal peptidase I [Trueperaceae bacterium]